MNAISVLCTVHFIFSYLEKKNKKARMVALRPCERLRAAGGSLVTWWGLQGGQKQLLV